jgi:alpha-1,6-mannosyltransferase
MVALGAVSGLLYAVEVIPLVSVPGGAIALHVAMVPPLFLTYLVAVWLVWRQPRPAGRRGVGPLAVILAFGALFRLILLPTPVYLSSDLYRYFWDGRVQLAGINPYRYPPAAPELAALRDDRIHPEINRPQARTIYPPGAQWVFTLAATAGVRTVVAWRGLLLAVEAITVVLLLAVLRRLALPEASVLVYAWSPLVIFEGVQAGHVDLFMVPLVLLALLWRLSGVPVRSGVALGLAVLLKLYPAILAVAWSARPGAALAPRSPASIAPRRAGNRWAPWRGVVSWWHARDWRFVAAVGGTVALGYAPYVWGLGGGALGFLPEYFGPAEDHNIGLRALLTWGIGWTSEVARGTMMTALFLVLLGTLLWLGRAPARPAPERTGAAAVGAYLLLVPTAMHPWYVVWMVPFLCLVPWRPWLYFSGAVSLSYVAYLVAPAPIPAWTWLAEYGPLFGLLGIEAWRARARRPAILVAPRPT